MFCNICLYLGFLFLPLISYSQTSLRESKDHPSLQKQKLETPQIFEKKTRLEKSQSGATIESAIDSNIQNRLQNPNVEIVSYATVYSLADETWRLILRDGRNPQYSFVLASHEEVNALDFMLSEADSVYYHLDNNVVSMLDFKTAARNSPLATVQTGIVTSFDFKWSPSNHSFQIWIKTINERGYIQPSNYTLSAASTALTIASQLIRSPKDSFFSTSDTLERLTTMSRDL